jgi:hypothetical protein
MLTAKQKYEYQKQSVWRETKNIQHNKRRNCPEGGDWFIDGFYYKMGLHGFIFSYDHELKEWLKSSKTVKEVFTALRSDDKRCFSIHKKAPKEIS